MKQRVEKAKESYLVRLFCVKGERMIENGLYVVKRDFLNVVSTLGGNCDIVSGDKRPVFCCIQDKEIDGLYWAIPTSDLAHRSPKQIAYYQKCMACDNSDLRSCYYHIVNTNRTALYKISSCYPITDRYIDHAYTVNGIHVVIKRNTDIKEIKRKFKRILAVENRSPNYFDQRITDIKNYLIAELERDPVGTET